MFLPPEDDDIFAVLNSLAKYEYPLDALNAYRELAAKTYWEQKDLPRVIAMSIACITHGLSLAESQKTTDPQKSRDILVAVKAIAYNLASFTWTGWDEPGIEIGATDLRLGLDAAKTNLRLAEELEKGSLPVSRAHWMLGAHYLASDSIELAKTHFEQAAFSASQAEARSEELLANGFSILASLRCKPSNPDLLARLQKVQGQLAGEEHGANFNEQINTARRVFIGS